MRNLDGRVKVITAIAPQVRSGDGAVDGAAIVRDKNYEELIVPISLGAATGSPTSFTAIFQAQHRDDSGDSWSNYGSSVTLDASGEFGSLHLDAKGMKDEFRVTATFDFTGGETPTCPVSAFAIYGESKYV